MGFQDFVECFASFSLGVLGTLWLCEWVMQRALRAARSYQETADLK